MGWDLSNTSTFKVLFNVIQWLNPRPRPSESRGELASLQKCKCYLEHQVHTGALNCILVKSLPMTGFVSFKIHISIWSLRYPRLVLFCLRDHMLLRGRGGSELSSDGSTMMPFPVVRRLQLTVILSQQADGIYKLHSPRQYIPWS